MTPTQELHEAGDAYDTDIAGRTAAGASATIAQATALHAQAERPNVFIKIPGTPEGLPAIEEATFAGIPINVTLLFAATQYLAAAEAYLRGVERRVTAGLDPAVTSVGRYSFPAGTPRSPTGSRRSCATAWASPRRRWPTAATGSCSTRALGPVRERGRPGAAVAVGPAPRRRTPTRPTCCT